MIINTFIIGKFPPFGVLQETPSFGEWLSFLHNTREFGDQLR